MSNLLVKVLSAAILFIGFCLPAFGQKVALMSPFGDVKSSQTATILAESLSREFRVLDSDMAAAAYRSVKVHTPFNLTQEQAKQIGGVVGCDFFVLVDAHTQRRASLQKADYFEAYAAVYTVSSRTGRLVRWELKTAEAVNDQAAEQSLLAKMPELASSIAAAVRQAFLSEAREIPARQIEEVPAEGSAAAKDFHPPVPYRRIKPEYTTDAYLHSVAATVEVMVDLDEQGNVLRTEVTRWAGYGLDESVTRAVKQMNWRPADRDGKALPMRFLLRYNFKKVERE